MVRWSLPFLRGLDFKCTPTCSTLTLSFAEIENAIGEDETLIIHTLAVFNTVILYIPKVIIMYYM